MLLALQIGLQQELRTSISHLTNRIDSIEDRTYILESQIEVVITHDVMTCPGQSTLLPYQRAFAACSQVKLFATSPHVNIALYQDISAVTSQRRKEFAPITAVLKECEVNYHWGFPTTLLITYQSQHLVITSPKDCYKQLQNWGIINQTPQLGAGNNHSQRLGCNK